MRIQKYQLDDLNTAQFSKHKLKLDLMAREMPDLNVILKKLMEFQVAIPSWALGTGGTRFGRFTGYGEPRTLEEKIEDVGLLHSLNKSSGSISLHIPWDIPTNPTEIKTIAVVHGIRFDAMNSNTFQDQRDQKYSYNYGSMQNVKREIRQQAIEHNI
jgi:L-rhamnose isomerase / sugar isomerase